MGRIVASTYSDEGDVIVDVPLGDELLAMFLTEGFTDKPMIYYRHYEFADRITRTATDTMWHEESTCRAMMV